MEDTGVIFAHQLLPRIRRLGIRLHRFYLGQDFGIAISGRRGGIDNASYFSFRTGAKDIERTIDVRFVRGHRLRDGSGHGRNRGKVKNTLCARKHRSNPGIIANIDFVQFDLGSNLGQIFFFAGTQTIENVNGIRPLRN